MGAANIWAWDDDNKVWVKVKVDANGVLEVAMAVTNLDDLADVYVPSPTDGYIFYWDDASARWRCKALPGAAWADITGKPASPSLEEMATEHDVDGTHGAITPASCSIKYTDAEALDQAKANIEDTPVDGHTEQGVSSNWAYDHEANKSAHQSNTIGLVFIIDGGGSAITTGQKGHLEVPFACTITGWTLLADQSGSIVIDVWKDTYANFPPTVGDTIAGSELPTLDAAQKNQDLALGTWTTAVAAGDILAFNINSVATVTRVTLLIRATKT